MLQNGHDLAGFRLLKEVNSPRYLNAYENLYIYKTKHNNMNIQTAQVESASYRYLTADVTVVFFLSLVLFCIFFQF